jgi:hypothetical protein
LRAFAKFAGSLSRTQSSLGSVNPVSIGLAVKLTTLSRPTFWLIESTCGWLRWSHQIRAGRMTLPAASSSVRPCIWPERPIAFTSSPFAPAAPRTPLIASCAASHQFSGRCSAHMGRSIFMSSWGAV